MCRDCIWTVMIRMCLSGGAGGLAVPRLGAGSAVGSVAHVWEWLWEQLCPPRVLVTTKAQCP